jgi:hypothetical protein
LSLFQAQQRDPTLGRFSLADTLVLEPGNPIAWDRYAYVLNNPVRYSDPSGHMIWVGEGEDYDDDSIDYDIRLKLLFDPYIGALFDDKDLFLLYNQSDTNFIKRVDAGMIDVYEQRDIDLQEIASKRLSNPINEDDYKEWVRNINFSDPEYFGVDELQQRVLNRNRNHIPFMIFLEKMNISFNSEEIWMNYESNYLDALMIKYTYQLHEAKKWYYQNVILNSQDEFSEFISNIIQEYFGNPGE